MAHDWHFDGFERAGNALIADGEVDRTPVRLVKPLTWMNRSGQALRGLRLLPDFELQADLMVVLDDAAIDVGRLRMRPRGGSGGHNGLVSISRALGTTDFARLRIGVGPCPPDEDLADWILEPMPEEEEEVIVGLLPDAVQAVRAWATEGVEPAMSRFNR
jgi:PTH1 family peptidyl-tRNA hydrolase